MDNVIQEIQVYKLIDGFDFIIISKFLLMPFSASNIDQIEKHLASHPYLSEGGLPGADDAQIYFDLGKLPNVGTHPNAHFWYLFINSFSNDLMKKWIEKAPKPAKKEEVKKPVVAADEDDLFGETSEPTPKVEKAKPQPKKVKEKPVAKSIVVFDVKVDDIETNLDELAKKILAREIDGLVWNQEPKKIDVAYGIQKLQIGCVIEDAKVLTDDIFDPIEAWEEVQSVDMVSMQKL